MLHIVTGLGLALGGAAGLAALVQEAFTCEQVYSANLATASLLLF